MSFRTDIEALVLATIREEPLHGCAIVRQIREQSGGLFCLGEGQLYPILHRLESKGWTEGEWEPQQGKPPRKVYRLTARGLDELTGRQKTWTEFSRAVESLFAT